MIICSTATTNYWIRNVLYLLSHLFSNILLLNSFFIRNLYLWGIRSVMLYIWGRLRYFPRFPFVLVIIVFLFVCYSYFNSIYSLFLENRSVLYIFQSFLSFFKWNEHSQILIQCTFNKLFSLVTTLKCKIFHSISIQR